MNKCNNSSSYFISILALISFSCSLSQSKDYYKERDDFYLKKGRLYYKEKPFRGKVLYNYTSGELMSEETFKEGMLFGAYKDFYENLTLKGEGIYSEVEFKIRKKPATNIPPPPPPPQGYNPDDTAKNHNQPIPMILLDSPPVFPGCEGTSKNELKRCFSKSIVEHIKKNFRYPIIAKLNDIEDRIFCDYTISANGKVIDIRIQGEKENSTFLAQELKRIISKLPMFKPGEVDGIAVSTKMNQPLTFRIPK